MDVRSQIAMVFHLDKCIGCHTCSIACKNVWTDRKGTEYMWWNNVETKPGTGYPDEVGGPGRATRAAGSSTRRASCGCKSTDKRAHGRQHLPQSAPCRAWTTTTSRGPTTTRTCSTRPRARTSRRRGPISMVTGEPIDIKAGPELGRRPRRLADLRGERSEPRRPDAEQQRRSCQSIERLVFFYLPRICNHCLNPSCVAACPSGALYKRGEDGIVLLDQTALPRLARRASRPARTRRSTTTGSPASRRSASSASRAWRPGRRRRASTRASAASATSACCSTTPTAARRGGQDARRRAGRGPALADPRPARPGGDRGGAAATASHDVGDRVGPAVAGLQVRQGVEDRAAAAHRVPHAADAVLRAAAVAGAWRSGNGDAIEHASDDLFHDIDAGARADEVPGQPASAPGNEGVVRYALRKQMAVRWHRRADDRRRRRRAPPPSGMLREAGLHAARRPTPSTG